MADARAGVLPGSQQCGPQLAGRAGARYGRVLDATSLQSPQPEVAGVLEGYGEVLMAAS